MFLDLQPKHQDAMVIWTGRLFQSLKTVCGLMHEIGRSDHTHPLIKYYLWLNGNSYLQLNVYPSNQLDQMLVDERLFAGSIYLKMSSASESPPNWSRVFHFRHPHGHVGGEPTAWAWQSGAALPKLFATAVASFRSFLQQCCCHPVHRWLPTPPLPAWGCRGGRVGAGSAQGGTPRSTKQDRKWTGRIAWFLAVCSDFGRGPDGRAKGSRLW